MLAMSGNFVVCVAKLNPCHEFLMYPQKSRVFIKERKVICSHTVTLHREGFWYE